MMLMLRDISNNKYFFFQEFNESLHCCYGILGFRYTITINYMDYNQISITNIQTLRKPLEFYLFLNLNFQILDLILNFQE